MLFLVMLIVTTIAIASSAAFFSVYGLAHLFTGALIPVIVMGSSLEAGKLIATSFLYRYFNKIGILLKIYLVISILVLMLITSIGIFGFLTAAYQKDTIPLDEMQQKISMYEEESTHLRNRLNHIDNQIADVGPNYVRAKERLAKSFEEERKTINHRLNEITPELTSLKTKHIDVKAKVGPIMFVAEVMNKDPNSAVFWFILILISVFDPLAVALTIAANIAIKHYREEKSAKRLIQSEAVKEVDMTSLRSYIDKQVKSRTESLDVG